MEGHCYDPSDEVERDFKCPPVTDRHEPLSQKGVDHEGTRTLNLLIRSQTPYPLGHAAAWY